VVWAAILGKTAKIDRFENKLAVLGEEGAAGYRIDIYLLWQIVDAPYS
jgi:hypothetical protein